MGLNVKVNINLADVKNPIVVTRINKSNNSDEELELDLDVKGNISEEFEGYTDEDFIETEI